MHAVGHGGSTPDQGHPELAGRRGVSCRGHDGIGLLARADESHADGVQRGDQLADVIAHQAENGVDAEILEVLGKDLVDGFGGHGFPR